MAKVFILNDTSRFHNGSMAVVSAIKKQIKDEGMSIAKSISSADRLICNGEGTFHHDRDKAIQLLDQYKTFAKTKSFINSVWDSMSPNQADKLRNSDKVIARDLLSHRLMESQGIASELALDWSYFCPLQPKKGFDFGNKIVVGHYYVMKKMDLIWRSLQHLYPSFMSLKSHSWSHNVASLRGAKLFVTGQHHGMYAAIKANTPFIVFPGNSWKIQGFLEWCGFDIPMIHNEEEIPAAIDKALSQPKSYVELFKWVKSQGRPKLFKTIAPSAHAHQSHRDPRESISTVVGTRAANAT